ncbi:MAG: Maf family protein, partial [Promethearchaeota archaeon]
LVKDGSFLELLPAGLENHEEMLHAALISADTIVVYKSEVFGKARNEFEAFATLSTLQGQTHKLLTGFHLMNVGIDLETGIIDVAGHLTGHSITKVKFSILTDSEIRGYLDSGEWKGRAGCYAIQYRASQFVQSIQGSHTGVIGLPIPLIVSGLEDLGLEIKNRA